MLNLLRMNRRRIFRSKMFFIAFLVLLTVSVASGPVQMAMVKAVSGIADLAEADPESTAIIEEELSVVKEVNLSDLIAKPFVLNFLALFILLLVVSFSYMDIENGFIKNIAGQQPKRSRVAVSKFLTVMLSNLVLMLTALGGQIASRCIVGKVVIDKGIAQAAYTFGVKWLLILAISAVLIFITVGIGFKPLATIMAVLAATGALGLFYIGADMALENLLHIKNFSLMDYAPDQLLTEQSYSGPRAIIVAVAFVVVFMGLTIWRANRTDIK